MTHDEALHFLVSRIDYERTATIPYGQREFHLDRMRRLLKLLGDPHLGLRVIHVAGTKGKGSTSTMIAAALQAAGKSVGLYTSPHLERVEERWQVNGRPCDEREFIDLIAAVQPAVDGWPCDAASGPPPTYFELTTAIAFLQFARRGVDAAVLEVGLGGRLDSTNICNPVLCIITSISLDHTQQLGETHAAIAREKAGIIKPRVSVVSGVRHPEAQAEIARVCRENGASLLHLGDDFDVRYEPARHAELADAHGRADIWVSLGGKVRVDIKECELGLLGAHQADNAAVAVAALLQLCARGWEIPESAIRSGLRDGRLPARIEVLRRRPTVVLDGSHNVASIAALCRTLDESFDAARRTLIFGGARDKDLRGMLEILLPRFERSIFTSSRHSPRAVPEHELLTIARDIQPGGLFETAPIDGVWDQASRGSRPDDLYCLCGSFYLAAELRGQVTRGALT